MAELGENMRPKEINISANKDVAKLSEVKKLEIKRFTPEGKEALKNDGYLFYESDGKSVKDLQNMGRKIEWGHGRDLRNEHEQLLDENEPSIRSEVAINPKKLFLGKEYKEKAGERIDEDYHKVITLSDKEAVDNFSSTEVSKKYPGAKAIIGSPATWAGVIFKHEEATGEKLFGEKYDYKSTGTETPTRSWNPNHSGSGEGVIIGSYGDRDLSIIDWGGGHGGEGVDIAPMVVPA